MLGLAVLFSLFVAAWRILRRRDVRRLREIGGCLRRERLSKAGGAAALPTRSGPVLYKRLRAKRTNPVCGEPVSRHGRRLLRSGEGAVASAAGVPGCHPGKRIAQNSCVPMELSPSDPIWRLYHGWSESMARSRIRQCVDACFGCLSVYRSLWLRVCNQHEPSCREISRMRERPSPA